MRLRAPEYIVKRRAEDFSVSRPMERPKRKANGLRPRAEQMKKLVEQWQQTTRGFSLRQLKSRAKNYLSGHAREIA